MLTDTSIQTDPITWDSNLETNIKGFNDCILWSNNYTLRFHPKEITISTKVVCKRMLMMAYLQCKN